MTKYPSFFQGCITIVKNILENHEVGKSVNMKTGPSYKTRGNSHVISWNFFFSDDKEKETFWGVMLEELDSKIISPVSCSSEVIKHESCKGMIIDSGQRSFEITKSVIYEIYLYKEETFIYLRTLEERDPASSKEWISLDVDLVEKTPWFLD
ncbi:MAG: hypothetical protein ACXAEU_07795 [Candidatus Hodarchaeales archaeon]|jgi:hypothetical protein